MLCTEYLFFIRMVSETYNFFILLVVAVLCTGACAEGELEDETVSVDRNSLSSIRLPSKFSFQQYVRYIYIKFAVCDEIYERALCSR